MQPRFEIFAQNNCAPTNLVGDQAAPANFFKETGSPDTRSSCGFLHGKSQLKWRRHLFAQVHSPQ